MVRSAIHRLADALNAATSPLFVLDERRRIVFWNEACERWTGAAAEALLGAVCVYQAPEPLDDSTPPDEPASEGSGTSAAEQGRLPAKDGRIAAILAAGLCPSPAALGGLRCRERREVWLRKNECLGAWVEYLPLARGPDEVSPIVALVDLAAPGPAPTDGLPPYTPAPEAIEKYMVEPAPGEPSAESLHRALVRFRARLGRRYAPEQFVGADPRIARARAQAALAALGDQSVMIVGPAGVGKEHLARAIHYSRHGDGAAEWAALACGALGAELLGSTLAALVARQSAAGPAPIALSLGGSSSLAPRRRAGRCS